MSRDAVVSVVLVEDDEIDAEAVRRELRGSKVACGLRVFADGDEALAAARAGAFPRPCLLVVDLNLPRLPGLELLEALREESYLDSCEVVVLSTSSAASDRARAHDLGARAYLAKSDQLSLGRLIGLIEDFARQFRIPAS